MLNLPTDREEGSKEGGGQMWRAIKAKQEWPTPSLPSDGVVAGTCWSLTLDPILQQNIFQNIFNF
jgi:hypothetical protein